jgi:hypothetical protein
MRLALVFAAMSILLLADGKGDRRYYHKAAKDYHEWNATEERAYNQFMTERRRTLHDFSQASGKEREEFWNWRHQHPEAGNPADARRQ